jgi:hypothetical protein
MRVETKPLSKIAAVTLNRHIFECTKRGDCGCEGNRANLRRGQSPRKMQFHQNTHWKTQQSKTQDIEHQARHKIQYIRGCKWRVTETLFHHKNKPPISLQSMLFWFLQEPFAFIKCRGFGDDDDWDEWFELKEQAVKVMWFYHSIYRRKQTNKQRCTRSCIINYFLSDEGQLYIDPLIIL